MVEKVTGARVISAQRDKTFPSSCSKASPGDCHLLLILLPLQCVLIPGGTNLTTCTLHAANGIVQKVDTVLMSCGCGDACSPLPLPSVSQPLLFAACYYITQTASSHQSKAAHTQNGLIILAGRAISPMMIPLTPSATKANSFFPPSSLSCSRSLLLHFIKRPINCSNSLSRPSISISTQLDRH